MKHFFVSAAVISVCLLGVWSQNFQISPSNLRSRRQDEKGEKSEPGGKGGGGSGFSGPQVHQTTSASTAYALPAGSEIIVGLIKTTFSCNGRIYGYYADPDNNCQIFHVCVPHENLENGLEEMIQYSFFCGNQTVFDQAALACNYLDDALPCRDAPGLYDEVNRKFGITDRPN